MIRAIAAAVIVMLVTTAASSIAFSKDEKSPNDCGKYLGEMSEDLDTLEALVPKRATRGSELPRKGRLRSHPITFGKTNL
jgi:hypothetical protein